VTYLPVTVLGFAFCLVAFVNGASAQVDTTRRQFPLDVISGRCIEFRNVTRGTEPDQIRDCRVSAFGEFGNVGGKTYYYATYCIIPNYADKGMCGDSTFTAVNNQSRGLAIFTRSGQRKNAALLFERVSSELGIDRYDIKPEIIRNQFGTILYVPIILDGTGNGNESEYYLLEAEVWKRIEFDSWFADLEKRIPRGLTIRKGIWPDLRTMRADAYLYKEGDTNCCPTGSVARMKLAIRDKKFTIDSLWLESPSH
jgi:hypothetical protein